MTRCILRPTLGLAAALALAVAGAGCAASRLRLPTDPGTPVADAARMLDEATAGCRGVRTLQAELGIWGRVGGDKVRGRVIAGFERSGAMRLEAVAPFGPPAFILVSRAGSASLLIPRDSRLLADAAPALVVEALTGVSLAPDDLLAILAGCISNDRQAASARAFANGWVGIRVADGTTVYLRPDARGWSIVAGIRGPLTVEYDRGPGLAPSRVRLRVADATGSVTAELDLSLAQVETNTSINPQAFVLRAPDQVVPLTLEELRRSGPLGQRR